MRESIGIMRVEQIFWISIKITEVMYCMQGMCHAWRTCQPTAQAGSMIDFGAEP